MHENICARIGSSNQDGLDSQAAALSQGGKDRRQDGEGEDNRKEGKRRQEEA